MAVKIHKISDSFWNIRGSFKIGSLIDIGTHASLVRKRDGKFILLDSLTLEGEILEQVKEATNNLKNIDSVLNLHPFHTLHVENTHRLLPHAKHYGTRRHIEKFPSLKWEQLKTEDEGLHQLFRDDLEFSVPRGVDFISSNERVHFSSVLAYHSSSRTIHVDDTLMYIKLPKYIRFFGLGDSIVFHPTLQKVLEERDGAADEFENWAREMASNWSDAENLCAAHTASFISSGLVKVSIYDRIHKAIKKVQPILSIHRNFYGD